MACRDAWLLALATLVACGDDTPTAGNTETTTDEAGTSTGSADGGPGGSGDTTGGPVSTDSGSSGATVDSTSTGSDPPPLEATAEVITYPSQPMVVDVIVHPSAAADVTLQHTTDPGVRIADWPAEDPLDRAFRVRGLLPASPHVLTWTATPRDGGDPVTDELAFTAEAPLPGFVPTFTVEGTGDFFGGFVLFDILEFPGPGPTSLFALDGDGRPRWHYGVNDGVGGPIAVFAAARLRDDGTVVFLRDDRLQIIDELGESVLDLDAASLGLPSLHHDVTELPNGNFLALSTSFADVMYADLGLTHVMGDLIVEIDPAGTVVWQWDTFDHLDPQRRREDFDLLGLDPDTLQLANDWTHGNAVVYDAAADTVLLSMRHQDWIVLIDRATGDVLWRFGEEGDFALTAGTWQFHQHSPQWQADGTLLLYDNAVGNPAVPDDQEFSRAVRYALDFGTMEAMQVWEDEAEDFSAEFAGDADRLPNGHILVTDSSIDFLLGMLHGRIREIDEASSATPTWAIESQLDQAIYRATAWDRLPGEAAP